MADRNADGPLTPLRDTELNILVVRMMGTPDSSTMQRRIGEELACILRLSSWSCEACD